MRRAGGANQIDAMPFFVFVLFSLLRTPRKRWLIISISVRAKADLFVSFYREFFYGVLYWQLPMA